MSELVAEAAAAVQSAASIRAWLLAAARLLHRAGVQDARVAAEWLMLAALDIDRAALYARLAEPLSPATRSQLDAWLQRCAAREPVAYVVGQREFWSRDFLVTHAVLVPRPETEHLIETALDCLPKAQRGARVNVCDVGTGCGCLAVSLACEWPGAEVMATDVSAAALAVARANARRHGVAERVRFVRTSVLEAFAPRSFDLIVSNPPYLSSAELEVAEPELSWEPRVALDGGADGLEILRALAADAQRVLRPGGWLVVEVGAAQAATVEQLVRQAGARQCFSRRDLAGWVRVVAARW